MRLNLDDLYLDILIKELNKGNLDGMKSEALAYRDKFLNEKSLQLKREWKRDAAFVSGSTVSSLAIPASGIVLTTAYLTDKFSYVAKEMGLKSFQKAAVGVGASTFVEEKCNEILDQIMEDCIKEMFTDAVFDIIPGLSLLLLFSKWTSHRQNVTGMIDKLQEKAKRYHHDVIEKCHERVMNGQIFQTNSLSDGVHGFPSDVEKKRFSPSEKSDKHPVIDYNNEIFSAKEPPILIRNTELNEMDYQIRPSALASTVALVINVEKERSNVEEAKLEESGRDHYIEASCSTWFATAQEPSGGIGNKEQSLAAHHRAATFSHGVPVPPSREEERTEIVEAMRKSLLQVHGRGSIPFSSTDHATVSTPLRTSGKLYREELVNVLHKTVQQNDKECDANDGLMDRTIPMRLPGSPSCLRRESLLKSEQKMSVCNFTPIVRYYELASKLFESFRKTYEQKDLDGAYVLGKRYATFCTDVLPTHSHYCSTRADLKRLRLENYHKLCDVANVLEEVVLMMDEEELKRGTIQQFTTDYDLPEPPTGFPHSKEFTTKRILSESGINMKNQAQTS